MDWNLAMEENRRMLKSIVALLFAFAGLAERLCGLPRPVRGFVLRILRSAEAIARDFVVDTTADQGAPPSPDSLVIPALQGGDSRADAMRLARSFRTLAVLLDRLADRNSRRRKRCITSAASSLAAVGRLSTGTRFEGTQPCFAAACLGVERRDSS